MCYTFYMTQSGTPQTRFFDAADGSRIEYSLWNGTYRTTTHVGGYAKTAQHVSQQDAWNTVKAFIAEHGGYRTV
jgi:hypothetical protein